VSPDPPMSQVGPAPMKPKRRTPGTLKQFWWDMLPKRTPDRFLPRRSGYKPPDPELEWITREIAEAPDALEQTRRAHDLERSRVVSLEQKGATIATLCLGLLAVALAVGGYQVGYLRREGTSQWWLLIPAVLAIAFLAMATITALEIQRVGVYQWEGAEPLGRNPGGKLGLVRSEETGRRLAQASARVKADGLLQTRAWLSRSLVALIISAFVTIAMATTPTQSSHTGGHTSRISPAPTSTSFRPAGN